MGLNKSVGNMYEFVTHTWSPVRGCEFDCEYCYVKSMKGYSLKPRIVEKELTTNLGSGNTIFVCSMADLFGEWVSDGWIESVLEHCNKFSENTYLFQSKNPTRFIDFLRRFPENTILGTTIETNRDLSNLSKAPKQRERALALSWIAEFKKEVTIEPILKFDLEELVYLIAIANPKFVAIGADSKKHNLLEPTRVEIEQLIHRLREFTEVKIKKNLSRLWSE